MKAGDKIVLTGKWRIGLLATVIAIVFIVFGYLFLRHEINRTRKEKETEFEAISKIKLDQIVQWQKERRGDAFVLSRSHSFVKSVEQWLSNKDNDYLINNIKEHLSLFQQYYSYQNISLSSIKLFLIHNFYILVIPHKSAFFSLCSEFYLLFLHALLYTASP